MSELRRRLPRIPSILLFAALGLAVLIAVPLFSGTVSPGVRETVPRSNGAAPGIVSASPPPIESPPAAPPGAGSPTPQPMDARRAVAIDQPGTITPGLTAVIASMRSVDGEASGPGEIAGPAVRFDVAVTNGTGVAVSLTNTIVNVYYGTERTPAIELTEPGGSPMPAYVGPDRAASGSYVFAVPADRREVVRITVDYSVQVPPLVFEGPIPR